MKTAYRITIVVILLALAALGLAAGAEIELPAFPEVNLADWAADAGKLALAVMFLVAVIRKWVWRAEGGLVPLLATVIGAALGAGLGALGYFENVTNGILHGLTAGVLAFGGVDGIRSVLKVGGDAGAASENNDTRTGAARLRR